MSALVDRNGLPLACTVSPAYVHDPQLYESTFEAFETPAFEIPGVWEAPIITADPAYDSRGIRQDNWKRRIKGNLLVNRRSWKHPKQGRLFRFDPELYKKRIDIIVDDSLYSV